VGNLRSFGSPYVDRGRLRAFFGVGEKRERALNKIAGELLNLSRNQLRLMTGLLTEHCHLNGHLIKLVLVNSPECDGYNQASEMASHFLCGCGHIKIQAPGSSFYESR
jgi:hypothetical protein